MPRIPCFSSSGVKGRKGSGSSGSSYWENPEASSGMSESAGTIAINLSRLASGSGQGVRWLGRSLRDGSTCFGALDCVIFLQFSNNNHPVQGYNGQTQNSAT